MKKEYIVKSLEETKKVAEEFSLLLKEGDTVLLDGDLGAGKTTFTKFVFECLGVKGNVTSPTFAILKIYEGKFKLNHFDMYRVNEDEAIESGFDEIIGAKDSVSFIEWSENVSSLIPKNTKKVTITRLGENERKFEFSL
ncbi:MAG: tRNA (adenosine(37)-N6)-threonylcarbamoyltransferase complex ATPase subunit type 1 TsaE [Clostridiales bacterium]|nr:tRNA (adenosine(37)-N6)-threonylcarbamoyltransferase complex ATPase subunit type 1 TsaE [Clostridiales bacterium]